MTPGALCSLSWARCPDEDELCSGASAASLTCSCSRCSRCPLAPLASQLLRSHQLLHPASLPPLALQDLQQSQFLLQESNPVWALCGAAEGRRAREAAPGCSSRAGRRRAQGHIPFLA